MPIRLCMSLDMLALICTNIHFIWIFKENEREREREREREKNKERERERHIYTHTHTEKKTLGLDGRFGGGEGVHNDSTLVSLRLR